MLRVPLLFLFAALALGLRCAAVAQGTPDPIQDFVGEWDVSGTATSITISPNHVIQHSRWGRGDIKWDNADYYNISYRDRSMYCHYIIKQYSLTELSIVRAETTDPPECDLGDMRRARPPAGAQKHSEKEKPDGGLEIANQGTPQTNPQSIEKPSKVTQAEPSSGTVGKPAKKDNIILDCEECPELVLVPQGSFAMGSPNTEAGHASDESPLHTVEIKQFALGRFPVTRKQFSAFVTETGYRFPNSCLVDLNGKMVDHEGSSFLNPGFFQDDTHPAVCVSWYDALAYASWLTKKTGKNYRLPTEAEREYSARAGTTTSYSFGDSISAAEANFNAVVTAVSAGSALKGTLPVESFEPNAFGLYQMHGNVSEWTQDCWNQSYANAPSNGSAFAGGDCRKRVLRGGAWAYPAKALRSSYREKVLAQDRYYHVGFRVARAAGD
jgi:formylglycine-generating enzyme required for sulfatase activity